MKISLKDYRDINSGKEIGSVLMQMIEENLDIRRWNFQPTFKNFVKASNLEVIYDSAWCRITFMFSRERLPLPQYDELHIKYGRLHAPNDEAYMILEGQKCYCWHNVLDSLWFLDGLSPFEAAQQAKRNTLPPVAEKFWQSERGKNLRQEYPPEFALALQSIVWEHYGQSLFELFDLHRSDLWEKYSDFMREYHKIKGSKSIPGYPSDDRIC